MLDKMHDDDQDNEFHKVTDKLHETDKAIKFRDVLGEFWVPKSVLVNFNDLDMEIEVPEWFEWEYE